jgi:hypothetical protein
MDRGVASAQSELTKSRHRSIYCRAYASTALRGGCSIALRGEIEDGAAGCCLQHVAASGA